MGTILKWPRSIMDTTESAALEAILDSPDRLRTLRLEVCLPLLFKMAGKDIVREEVDQCHSGYHR